MVSLIIPVYNVAPYIENCLRSVMRQTYTGAIECLIIDDCGCDDSITIVERMLALYEGNIRFLILHHTHNRGLSAARNTGTLAAKGDYVYYLDSDDEITPDCIEKLMRKMKEDPETELVQGNSLWYFPHGATCLQVRNITIPLAVTNEEVRKCFYQLGQMNVNVWNKLIRRDFITQNNILCLEGVLWEDTPWTFKLLKHLKKASFTTEVTHHYRKRPHSITIETSNRDRGLNYCIIYQYILSNLTPEYERQEIGHHAKGVASYYSKYVCVVPEFEDVFLQWKNKVIKDGIKYERVFPILSSTSGFARRISRLFLWRLMGFLEPQMLSIKLQRQSPIMINQRI